MVFHVKKFVIGAELFAWFSFYDCINKCYYDFTLCLLPQWRVRLFLQGLFSSCLYFKESDVNLLYTTGVTTTLRLKVVVVEETVFR